MSGSLDQSQRLAELKSPFGDKVLVLKDFTVSEGLSELFEIVVEAISEQEITDFSSKLGQPCTVSLKTRDGSKRYFNGVLAEARWVGKDTRYHVYELVLRPWLWLLSKRADCRIFADKEAKEIIQKIFEKEGKAKFEFRLTEQYQKMEYCVQYRETDLDFVSRLMEQHGIFYYFVHEDGKHLMVLTDSPSKYTKVTSPKAPGMTGLGSDGSFPVLPDQEEQNLHVEHLQSWTVHRRLETGKMALRDYDYKKSTADLTGTKTDGIDPARQFEVYDYPGKYTERSDGERFAKIRVEAAQALDDRRRASGSAPSMFPGARCDVSNTGFSGEDRAYAVLRARHRYRAQLYSSGGDMEEEYNGAYEFLPADKAYRAPPLTPKPRINGPQTAKVVGKNREKGEEIYVEKDGCIYVQFHWDREDKTTSRPVRVAQVWSGKGWGGQVIPRVGQEVVVEFLEGDPDQPLVTGTVYNDQYTHPYDLPSNKTQSGWKTDSSKGGNGYNELMFEDKKSEEKVKFRAEKDLESLVRNTEKREVGEAFSRGTCRSTKIKHGDDVLSVEDGKLLIDASDEIVLKCGGSKITMKPMSIKIESMAIEIDADATIKEEAGGTMTLKGAMIMIN